MREMYPDYSQEGMKPIEEKLKLKEVKILNNFLEFCRQTSKPLKVKSRWSELLQVRDIIGKDFNLWKLEDIRGFLAVLNNSNRSPWTKKGILVTLQMFVKFQFKDWSLRFNNLEDAKKLSRLIKPSNDERYKDLPTAEEINELINKANSVRNKLYISMMAEAGLPPIVEVNLKFQDIKIDSPEEGVSTLEYFRTKNKESFIFPLGKITTFYLKEWKKQYPYSNQRSDDFIFPGQERDKPITRTAVYNMLKDTAKKAGITKPIYQYVVRHKVLSENYDIFTEEVHRKLFGHTKGSVQTKTYSHKKDKEKTLMEAITKLHKIETITKEQENKYDREIKKLKATNESLSLSLKKEINELRQELLSTMESVTRQMKLYKQGYKDLPDKVKKLMPKDLKEALSVFD